MPVPVTRSDLRLARLATAKLAPASDAGTEAPPAIQSAMLKLAAFRPIVTLFPLKPATPGFDRAAAQHPIAETTTPDDRCLFVSASGDASFYLPRYRLKQAAPARYDIAIADSGDGSFRFSLGFERFPSPETAVPVGAKELPHDIQIMLSYVQGGLTKTVSLSEIGTDADGLPNAAAERLSFEARNALIIALKREQGVQIIVRRTAKVTAQLPATAHTPTPAPSPPPEKGASLLPHIRPSVLLRRRVRPLAFNLKSSPSLAKLAKAKVHLQERRKLHPAPKPEPAIRYHDVDLVSEQTAAPDPLVLDPALHGYFFENLGVASNTARRRLTVPFGEGDDLRHFAYFQDSENRALFYYLPDVYRLGRDHDAPFYPEMAVRLTTPDSIDHAAALIDFVLRPAVSPGRIEAAVGELAKAIPPSLAQQGAAPQLEPLLASAKLKLRVPGAGGEELRLIDEVAGDTANGLSANIAVSLEQFRLLFASAFAEDATSLFTGEAVVETGAADAETVPVDIRFAATEGPIFDMTSTPQSDGSIAVTLRNATESSLKVNGLPVELVGLADEIGARIEGLSLSPPAEVAPEEDLSFIVRAADGDAPDDAAVLFDFDDVDILARADQILPVITAHGIDGDYSREIEVLLVEPTDAPDPIRRIDVQFRGGDTVTLDPQTTSVKTKLRLPLSSLLLGEDTAGPFFFRQQIIRRSGEVSRDADWRSSDFDVLAVPAAEQ